MTSTRKRVYNTTILINTNKYMTINYEYKKSYFNKQVKNGNWIIVNKFNDRFYKVEVATTGKLLTIRVEK